MRVRDLQPTCEMFGTSFTCVKAPGFTAALKADLSTGSVVFVRKGDQWRTKADNKSAPSKIAGMLDTAFDYLSQEVV